MLQFTTYYQAKLIFNIQYKFLLAYAVQNQINYFSQCLKYIITHHKYSIAIMISGVVNSFASVTILRILSRVLEFFLRVYLIRQVLSPEILAQMVALDLILTTSLHIAKNCFKPSYQQVQSKSQKENIISSMNLMSIGILATLISAIVVVFLQWNHKIQLSYVNEAILLFGFCGILEALKEKYSVQFTLRYQYRKIALIELFSYLPKTLVLFIAAKTGMFQKYGILMFGIGQMIFYGICLIATLYFSHYRILFMRKLEGKDQYLDNKTKKILKQLSFISVIKLLLQQFEKIVLVFNNAVEDSSIYSLVSNLGSIIVRFVFAPLQQIAYNYYARGSEQQSKKTLISLVRMIAIFSFLSIGFGFRYAENVLFILYGEKWVNQHSIFAFQSYMILLGVLGINGTMEAFVMARADVVKTVPKFKYFTLLSTMVFISSSLVLLHFGLGAAALFLGNTIGMLARILISWNIEIKRHISLSNFLKGIFPNKIFILILLLSLYMSYKIKQKVVLNPTIDLGVGIILCGLTLLPALYSYKEEIITFISKNKNKISQVQKQA